MSDIRILPLGSGSTGNCFYIEIGGYRILLDLGIGYRRVKETLFRYERNLEDVDAIFLTHGHYDHVKAALPVTNHTSCRVYADSSVMYSIRNIKAERETIQIGECFEPLEGLFVTPFSVPHDFVRTCGYVFECKDRKLVYVTDCGEMNGNILDTIKGADVLIIESNHDVEMLRNGPYPYPLQRRILSRYGHMSNDQCADTIEIAYQYGTRNFLLAHVSLNNNTFEMALKTTQKRMEGKDVRICVCHDQGDGMMEF